MDESVIMWKICNFQPNNKYDDDIAIIVLYLYLMYAYDFSESPYINE